MSTRVGFKFWYLNVAGCVAVVLGPVLWVFASWIFYVFSLWFFFLGVFRRVSVCELVMLCSDWRVDYYAISSSAVLFVFSTETTSVCHLLGSRSTTWIVLLLHGGLPSGLDAASQARGHLHVGRCLEGGAGGWVRGGSGGRGFAISVLASQRCSRLRLSVKYSYAVQIQFPSSFMI